MPLESISQLAMAPRVTARPFGWQRTTRAAAETIPDLEGRIDDLLAVPTAAMRLPADILGLYRDATAVNARVTVMRWSVLAAGINLFSGAFDVSTIPGNLLAMDIAFRLTISLSFLFSASLFHRKRSSVVAEWVLIIPCLMMLIFAGTTGLMTGDAAVLERVLCYGFITTMTAVMFFPIGIRHTMAMAGLCVILLSGYIAMSMINSWAVKCQIIAVDAGAMGSVVWGRHVMNLYLARLFLLNTREEMRASKAARLNEQLSSIAYTDPLTNVPTRRYFDEICAAMSEKTKHLFPLSLCMIDIDHFKALNDSLGHLQGDRCLRVIAAAITGHLRKTDILARYGGEEFVLLLPGTDKEKALEITERVRAAIVSLGHPNPGSPFHMVTASFGVATVAQPPLAIEVLITEADTALYRAKMTGRNRVSV